MEDQAQQLIDATTAAFKAGKIATNPFSGNNGAAIPPPVNYGPRPGPPGPVPQGPPMMPPPMMMGPHGPMPPMMGMPPPMMGPMVGPMMGQMRPPPMKT